MKEKPVMPLVISMAFANDIFPCLVNALYNIIDSYFVARISEDAMTALSFGVPICRIWSMQFVYRICNWNQCDNRIFSWSTKAEQRRIKQRRWEHFLNMIHGLILGGSLYCSHSTFSCNVYR